MLPGWCCIAIAALELRNGDSWYHMCAFRFHFWGRKVNWNQASHVRASSVPTLYACCLTKRSCHFLFVARVGLCCWFCDFAVSFLVPPDGPKNGTVKVLFFYSFTKLCMRSQKWDRQFRFIFCFLYHGSAFAVDFAIFRSHFWYRQTVPKMGPWKCFSSILLGTGGPIFGTVLGSFFEVFCIKVAEAQRFGFNEPFWLMATGRATREALLRSKPVLKNEAFPDPELGPSEQAVLVSDDFVSWLMAGRATREALLSEAGFEKLFRKNWVRRSKLFCRWFCFLLGQAGCISVAAWTQLKDVEGSFLWFRFVWWLDCLLLKEGASAFCSLRWLLEVFLAVAEFVGFRAGGRLPFEWLYWILYCPLLAPLAPLDSYRSFRPRKNMNYVFFSRSRY